MIDNINQEGERGNHQHKAVIGGASCGRREFLVKLNPEC